MSNPPINHQTNLSVVIICCLLCVSCFAPPVETPTQTVTPTPAPVEMAIQPTVSTPLPTEDILQIDEYAQFTAVPTPEYLSVWPRPGTRAAQVNFRYRCNRTLCDMEAPFICIGVDPEPVLETGDAPTRQHWLASTHLVVNGDTYTDYDALGYNDSGGYDVLDPITGEVLYTTPDGAPYDVCYEVDLDVGWHEATYVIQQTSGNLLKYTWYFEIVE